MALRVSISHWLPIITFCPVNRLPDAVYITVTFRDGELQELYGIRKRIRQVAAWKLAFMEDIALLIKKEFPEAAEVKLELLFGRHVVIIKE